jgi:hypothetical protein
MNPRPRVRLGAEAVNGTRGTVTVIGWSCANINRLLPHGSCSYCTCHCYSLKVVVTLRGFSSFLFCFGLFLVSAWVFLISD